MSIIGQIDSLWRYPVKSMRGEELVEAFVSFAGIHGDRIYAFRSAAQPKGFPYLTGREQEQMLLYRPRFRHPDKAARPANLAEAEGIAPGLTPLVGDPADLAVDVETPSGDVLPIDDPALLRRLGDAASLTLLRADRAMTDCRPVSLFALGTARQLAAEVGVTIDKRRFRANIYADLGGAAGFAEDGFVGRRLRLGAKAVIAILERDPRCKMITLDPDTAAANPEVLRRVARGHDGKAGVYGAVLVEGMVRPGDAIELLDEYDYRPSSMRCSAASGAVRHATAEPSSGQRLATTSSRGRLARARPGCGLLLLARRRRAPSSAGPALENRQRIV